MEPLEIREAPQDGALSRRMRLEATSDADGQNLTGWLPFGLHLLVPPAGDEMRDAEAEGLFVHDGSEKRGPLTVERFEALLEQGEIDAACSYWYEGMAGWRPVTCFVRPDEQPSQVA